MAKAQESVYNYIVSMSDSQSNVVSNIVLFGLATVLTDKLKSLDRNAYMSSQASRLMQKYRNQVFEAELLALSKESRRAGIKLVHLKGLSLAKDLYEPAEARIFGDVDILLRPKNIKTALQLLNDMGYSLSDPADPPEGDSLDRLIDSEAQHHISLTKQVRGVRVDLELHYNLRSNVGLDVSTDEVVSRSTERLLSGQPIYVLELHDQLLYLMIHCASHYSSRLATLPVKGIHPATEVRRLHDIALLIEKHKSDIDWNTITERAIQWRASVPTLCCLQLLQRVYGLQIGSTVLDRLSDRVGFETSALAHHQIHEHEVVKIDCDDILMADIDRLVKEIHPRLSINNPLATCSHRSEPSSGGGSEIVIDENSDVIPNRFGTHLRAGEKPASSADCSAHARLNWDSESLHICVTVEDDVPIFGSQDDHETGQDSVELFIYTKESGPLLRHFVLLPSIDTDGPRMRIESGAADSEGTIAGLAGSCVTRESGYEVRLSIPWKALGAVPYKGMRFWLDVIVTDWDDRGASYKSRLAWSGSRSPWADITAFGNVVLV